MYKTIIGESRDKSIRQNIMTTIRQSNGHASFEELMDVSGLSFLELSSMIGRLLKEGTVKLSVTRKERGKGYRIRTEELFDEFMVLLSENFTRERSVKFYASELCITPKYLTTVIKSVSGKTPTAWISEMVFKEMEHRLRYSQASIKEIAYGLHFPNTSFFGKFFKARSGMSPMQYRLRFAVPLGQDLL